MGALSFVTLPFVVQMLIRQLAVCQALSILADARQILEFRTTRKNKFGIFFLSASTLTKLLAVVLSCIFLGHHLGSRDNITNLIITITDMNKKRFWIRIIKAVIWVLLGSSRKQKNDDVNKN